MSLRSIVKLRSRRRVRAESHNSALGALLTGIKQPASSHAALAAAEMLAPASPSREMCFHLSLVRIAVALSRTMVRDRRGCAVEAGRTFSEKVSDTGR